MIIDKNNCIRCRKCESICPVQGLNIDNETTVDDCIACYQCIAICQSEAIDNVNKNLGNCFQINITPQEFELLMQQRRSHRIFKSKPIAPETLTEFVNRMRFSPTASNSQNLSFTIINNPDVLQQVNDLTISTITKAFNKGLNIWTKPLVKLLKGQAFLNRMQRSKDKFIRKSATSPDMITYNAPALILIHSEQSPTGMPTHDANIWTGMATLYAELLELSTCINGYIVNAMKRNKAIKELTQIPANHDVHSALLIGYPKVKYYNRVERKQPPINII